VRLSQSRLDRLRIGQLSTATLPPEPAAPSALLDVRAVARLLACSTRHVYRLCDSGRMPPPIRVGALVRWQRQAISDWIAAGCPAVRRG
jgi:excisionase family DNA binding protein